MYLTRIRQILIIRKLAVSLNYCNFIVFNYKEIQTIITTLTASKVTELFCLEDDFCKFFLMKDGKIYAEKAKTNVFTIMTDSVK